MANTSIHNHIESQKSGGIVAARKEREKFEIKWATKCTMVFLISFSSFCSKRLFICRCCCCFFGGLYFGWANALACVIFFMLIFAVVSIFCLNVSITFHIIIARILLPAFRFAPMEVFILTSFYWVCSGPEFVRCHRLTALIIYTCASPHTFKSIKFLHHNQHLAVLISNFIPVHFYHSFFNSTLFIFVNSFFCDSEMEHFLIAQNILDKFPLSISFASMHSAQTEISCERVDLFAYLTDDFYTII